jgi:hypothetical protein
MKPYMVNIHLGINSCISFRSSYDPFCFNYIQDIYRYGSKQRRTIKQTHNLTTVQDHHIIPKSLRYHPLFNETNFPIHCSKNIKMMPTNTINEYILVHKHHYKYNLFIKEKLDEIYETNDNKKGSIINLIEELDIKLNYKNSVPWD